jgi:ATP-dependent helicase/nuclease subunit A
MVYTNDRRGLTRFFADAEPFYQKAESITTAAIINDHRTPTSFRENALVIAAGGNTADFKISAEYSGASSPDVFEKVDLILKRFLKKEESFGPADFGTIAHACVEALLNKREALIPPRLGGHLSLTEADTLLVAGKELAERFLQSPLGHIAEHPAKFSPENTDIRKSEYQFRSLIKNSDGRDMFINGTIDLLFTDGDTVHVVDFKTDGSENPAEHVPQMAFYYRAAFDLFGKTKTCRIWLYYLRTGHAVEMTEAAQSFNINGLAEL